MTSAQKVSAIKRINTRFQDIKKGVEKGEIPQYVLDNYQSAMQIVAGDNLTKSGLISHGKRATDEITDEALNALSKRETLGKIKKKLKEGAQKEYDTETPTDEELQEYVDMVETVHEAANETPNELSDAINSYGAAARKGSHTPYSILADALKKYREGARKERATSKSGIDRYFGGETSPFEIERGNTSFRADIGR